MRFAPFRSHMQHKPVSRRWRRDEPADDRIIGAGIEIEEAGFVVAFC
jgi:hypothetical protein